MPRSPHRQVPFDLAGQLAPVLAMGGLTYAVIEAGAAGRSAVPSPWPSSGALLADQAGFMHGLRTSLVITVLLLLAAVAAPPLLKAGPRQVDVGAHDSAQDSVRA